MDDFFNSISVISGQWLGDNKRLCVPCLQLERSPPQAGLKHRTTRPIGQCLTYRVTVAPNKPKAMAYELHCKVQ